MKMTQFVIEVEVSDVPLLPWLSLFFAPRSSQQRLAQEILIDAFSECVPESLHCTGSVEHEGKQISLDDLGERYERERGSAADYDFVEMKLLWKRRAVFTFGKTTLRGVVQDSGS